MYFKFHAFQVSKFLQTSGHFSHLHLLTLSQISNLSYFHVAQIAGVKAEGRSLTGEWLNNLKVRNHCFQGRSLTGLGLLKHSQAVVPYLLGQVSADIMFLTVTYFFFHWLSTLSI